MRKDREFNIDVPIYNLTAHLVFTEDTNKYLRKLEKKMGWTEDTSNPNFTACVTWDHSKKPGEFWIILPHNPDIGTVVHEVFHLTHRMAERVNVIFHWNNHEPFAYLHEFLFLEIHKRI